jgi:hypothetical protein
MFVNFKLFFIEFNFARVENNGELDTDEETLRWIVNVNKTEAAINESKTRAGSRPAMSYHDPHFPLPSRTTA